VLRAENQQLIKQASAVAVTGTKSNCNETALNPRNVRCHTVVCSQPWTAVSRFLLWTSYSLPISSRRCEAPKVCC